MGVRKLMKNDISINGTIDDAAAFFRVSRPTVERWLAESPPVLGHWKIGRNVTIGEEHAVELWLDRERIARRLLPADAQERARKLWRNHILARTKGVAAASPTASLGEVFEALTSRVARLEALFTSRPAAVIAAQDPHEITWGGAEDRHGLAMTAAAPVAKGNPR